MIDSHQHVFPQELAFAPWSWARQRNELHWAETVAPEGGRSLQGWANVDECLRAMDAAGLEKSLLLGWYWLHAETCDWHNALMAKWQKQHSDRFLWFASIPMSSTVATIRNTLQRAYDSGASGAGELHFGVQQFDFVGENWQCLTEFCRTHKWPINLHVTDPHGKDHPGRVHTPLLAIREMLHKETDLTIILAHLAGGMAFDPSYKLPANCLMDTAALPWLYPIAQLQQAIDNGYADQICFGSDYPLRLYPRTSAHDSLKQFASAIRDQLSGNYAKAITSENLLGILPQAGC